MRNWLIVTTTSSLAIAGGVAIHFERTRRRRLAAYRRVARVWQCAPEGDREVVLSAFLETPETSPAARFLQGAMHLRKGRVRLAARAFGMAYHGEFRIESAALLTFACLKAREAAPSDVLEQIAKTWMEMKRPRLFQAAEERILADVLEATTRAAPPLSELGRLAWCVVSPTEQTRVEEIPLDAPRHSLALLRPSEPRA